METVRDFIFLGSKITADGDCSHEMKRLLLLGRKVMTNLDSILKSRDITLPSKVRLVKAMVFSSSHVWMWELDYKESWVPKIDAFELWCWRRNPADGAICWRIYISVMGCLNQRWCNMLNFLFSFLVLSVYVCVFVFVLSQVRDFIFWGSKITADGDCSHEIKRHLPLRRKAMINLDSILKSRDITLPSKVHLAKAMVFLVVMYVLQVRL